MSALWPRVRTESLIARINLGVALQLNRIFRTFGAVKQVLSSPKGNRSQDSQGNKSANKEGR
jgi:hypothetical protein